MSFSSAVAMPRWTVLRVPVSRRSAVSGSDSRNTRSGRSVAMARTTPPITATRRSVPASDPLAWIWSTSSRRARHPSTSPSRCSRWPPRRYRVARATPRRPASDRMSSRCPAAKASTAAVKISAGIAAGAAAPPGTIARASPAPSPAPWPGLLSGPRSGRGIGDSLFRRLLEEGELVGQVAGQDVDIRDELTAADQAEVQLAKVTDQGDVQALAVGDDRHRVVRQEPGPAQVDLGVRAGDVRDGDVERRQPVQDAGGEHHPGRPGGQRGHGEVADLVDQAL